MRRTVPLTTGPFLAAFSCLPGANWIVGGRRQQRDADVLGAQRNITMLRHAIDAANSEGPALHHA